MKQKKVNVVFVVFLSIVILFQGFLYFYFQGEFDKAKNLISDTENSLSTDIMNSNSEIEILKQETDVLEKNLLSTKEEFFESQEDLQKEIGTIKADTSSDFSLIIEDAVQAVVSIKTNVAQGTGFLITNDGYVVTNAHVLEGAKYATAITSDLNQISMSLIGYTDNYDLALLKIEGNYEYLELGDSDDMKVGEKVIAIGNPRGLAFSVTEGIISAVHRTVSSYDGVYIQTDAALNEGNSGGPLINTDGEVVGINNFKVEGDNIGLSLESNIVVEKVNEIAIEKLGFELI